jgi:putative sigma-54 modulation protein
MQISVTGQHIDVTPALREHVTQRLTRVNKHFDHLIDAHVVLEVIKLDHHAEATVSAAGKSFFAEATESDMYAAVDSMADKLDRQVIKYKEKLTDHHRDEKASIQ